jgi:kynurenine formamidase
MLTPEIHDTIIHHSKVYDLGQSLYMGMPVYPTHPPYIFSMVRRHGDIFRENGFSGANELLVMCGHTGTHLDGLGHVSQDCMLYGDVNALETQKGGRGLKSHGMETVAPILCRGILLDVPAYQGIDVLPVTYEVSPAELEAVAKSEGVTINPGDVVFIRTGWMKHWNTPQTYIGHETGLPGPNGDSAEWLASKSIRVTGSDTITYEFISPNKNRLPAHMTLLVKNGIHIIEMINLEELSRDHIYSFLTVITPLKIVGATGSPIRPLAIV